MAANKSSLNTLADDGEEICEEEQPIIEDSAVDDLTLTASSAERSMEQRQEHQRRTSAGQNTTNVFSNRPEKVLVDSRSAVAGGSSSEESTTSSRQQIVILGDKTEDEIIDVIASSSSSSSASALASVHDEESLKIFQCNYCDYYTSKVKAICSHHIKHGVPYIDNFIPLPLNSEIARTRYGQNYTVITGEKAKLLIDASSSSSSADAVSNNQKNVVATAAVLRQPNMEESTTTSRRKKIINKKRGNETIVNNNDDDVIASSTSSCSSASSVRDEESLKIFQCKHCNYYTSNVKAICSHHNVHGVPYIKHFKRYPSDSERARTLYGQNYTIITGEQAKLFLSNQIKVSVQNGNRSSIEDSSQQQQDALERDNFQQDVPQQDALQEDDVVPQEDTLESDSDLEDELIRSYLDGLTNKNQLFEHTDGIEQQDDFNLYLLATVAAHMEEQQ